MARETRNSTPAIRSETLYGVTTLDIPGGPGTKNWGYILAVPSISGIFAFGLGFIFLGNLEDGETLETWITGVLFAFLSLFFLWCVMLPFCTERIVVDEERISQQFFFLGIGLPKASLTFDRIDCLELNSGNFISGYDVYVFAGPNRRLMPASTLNDTVTREVYDTLVPLLSERVPELELAPHGQYTKRHQDRSQRAQRKRRGARQKRRTTK